MQEVTREASSDIFKKRKFGTRPRILSMKLAVLELLVTH
jgi:hypothetical protein